MVEKIRRLLSFLKKNTASEPEGSEAESTLPEPIHTLDEYLEVFGRRPGAGADE